MVDLLVPAVAMAHCIYVADYPSSGLKSQNFFDFIVISSRDDVEPTFRGEVGEAGIDDVSEVAGCLRRTHNLLGPMGI